MATKDDDKDFFNEEVTFIQHDLPGLDAGNYQLTVEQQVLHKDNSVISEPYINTYTFGVQGDRFSLASPTGLIESVFPADNSTGDFSNVLPHVVFTKTTFPWLRYPSNDEPYTPPQPGTDVDGDVPTWLWVMVLDEDDPDEYQTLKLTPTGSKIGDLFNSTVVPGSTLANGDFSIFSRVCNTDDLEVGQTTDSPIQTIDIPLALFWELAPSLDMVNKTGDLYQTAHVRKVDITNQPRSNAATPAEPVGSFSIVFGNRLPAMKKKSTAYLVSLETLQDFLPLPGGIVPPAPPHVVFGAIANIRLIVLKSWSFYSVSESAAFVQQFDNLNGGIAGNTNLKLDYIGTNDVVIAATNMGYVPLNETMRTAEKNVAWYRGPLIPYKNTVTSIKTPIPSPDAATVFDPTTGMLDTSYAAAWTIGRMVALQDLSFSVTLYNWKKSLISQVSEHVQIKMIRDQFGISEDNSTSDTKQHSIFKQTVLALKPK
jgi:hypothetical protein